MKRLSTVSGVIAAAIGCAGCATYSYETTPVGRLEGQLLVVWVEEDHFIYWPAPEDPLRFHLSPQLARKTGVEVVRPGLMYTDGGSIPRQLRSLKGFSPWGYAPAYIVHDWIFRAHHCVVHAPDVVNDPKDGAEYAKVAKFDFDASVEVLAEVMKTLMDVDGTVAKNTGAFDAISYAVETPFVERVWNDPNPDSCKRVDARHRRMVEGALAGASGPRVFSSRIGMAGRVAPETPAVVFRYRFGR